MLLAVVDAVTAVLVTWLYSRRGAVLSLAIPEVTSGVFLTKSLFTLPGSKLRAVSTIANARRLLRAVPTEISNLKLEKTAISMLTARREIIAKGPPVFVPITAAVELSMPARNATTGTRCQATAVLILAAKKNFAGTASSIKI